MQLLLRMRHNRRPTTKTIAHAAYGRKSADRRLAFFGARCYIIPDILAIEACGSLQNLLDKRSRFAPSVHSLLAVCPVAWLLKPVMSGDPTPRWKATGVLTYEPAVPFVLPVRDMHVLYGLKPDHYAGFARHQLPHAHEYFAPMEALTNVDSEKNPELQALLARTSATANFLRA